MEGASGHRVGARHDGFGAAEALDSSSHQAGAEREADMSHHPADSRSDEELNAELTRLGNEWARTFEQTPEDADGRINRSLRLNHISEQSRAIRQILANRRKSRCF